MRLRLTAGGSGGGLACGCHQPHGGGCSISLPEYCRLPCCPVRRSGGCTYCVHGLVLLFHGVLVGRTLAGTPPPGQVHLPTGQRTCWMMPCVANQPAMHLARTSSLSVVCVEASALQGRPTPTSPCSSKRSACCCTHSPPDDSDPTVLPSLHLASAAVAVMSHRSCSSCRTPPPAACHPTKSRHCWWTPPQSCSTWPQAGRPPALHLVAWPLRWLEDRGQRQQQQHRAQPA